MAKRRGNHEGTIRQRTDGTWEATISIGHDPVTGKLKRVSFYGKSQKEVVEKAAKARTTLAQGTFVAPHRIPLGEWLDTWLWTYKQPRMRPQLWICMPQLSGAIYSLPSAVSL
jgi:integrase